MVITNNTMYNRCNYNQFRHQIACFTNYTHTHSDTLSFTVGLTVILVCWRVCVDNNMLLMGLCWGIPNTGARPYEHAPKRF